MSCVMASSSQALLTEHGSPISRNPKSSKHLLMSRRCRSVSPPIKRKSGDVHTALPSTRPNLIDGLMLNMHNQNRFSTSSQRSSSNPLVVQFPDDKRFAQPISPVQVHPVIKHINNYSVKQPKPRRTFMIPPVPILDHHRRSFSISSNPSEKVINSLVEMNSVESKVRKVKVCHPRSSSTPVAAFKDVKRQHSAEERLSMFDVLPAECIIRIFSFLPQITRGKCQRVCKRWWHLVRCPQLWLNVDFQEFNLNMDYEVGKDNMSNEEDIAMCNRYCYGDYIGRIDGYISFLIDIKPRIRRLSFAFDIISDNWFATVERLLIFVDLTELQYAHLNWKDTPVKPYWLEPVEVGLNDLLYKSRRRQRKFLQLFELFTQEAPNISTLILPFDWSARSIQYLLSLKKLRNLTLEKYFILQRFNQENLNALGCLRSLERLILEVWSPSASEMNRYTISSKTLQYLDVSQCRGFYLASVNLPSLQVFLTERKPWGDSLAVGIIQNQMNEFPCIQEILYDGTNNLVRINHLYIEGQLYSPYAEELMLKICPCKKHKPS